MNAKNRKRHLLIQFLLGWALSSWIVVLLVHQLGPASIAGHFGRLQWFPLFAAFICVFVAYLLRGFRWPCLYSRGLLSAGISIRSLFESYFLNNLFPGRLGESARTVLAERMGGRNRLTLLPGVAAERLVDGLIISLLFLVLFGEGLPGTVLASGRGILYLAYFFAALAFLTTLLLFKRRVVLNWLGELSRTYPGHLSMHSLRQVHHFVAGFEGMLHPFRLGIAAALSLAIWSLELSAYGLVAAAFDQQLSLATLALFLAAVNFSSLLPIVPGGVGIIEGVSTVVLIETGVAPAAAFSMTAVQHLLQFVVVGIPGFFLLCRSGWQLPLPASGTGEGDAEDEENLISPIGEDPELARLLSSDPTHAGDELSLSVVIPAFNEENRLPKSLLSVLEHLEQLPESYEVIVVDDGSSDATPRLVRQFEHLFPKVSLLICPKNRGKGSAVRHGVMNARGKLILFADADGATPIEELARLKAAVDKGAHVAIGSRALYSRDTKVATVWYRKLMGRVYNGFVNFLILPGIADTQCGFKLFVRPVARYLFSKQEADGFSFDVEILFLARKAGCRIAEVPVNWTNVAGSKVHLVRDSIRMFIDILRFRLRYAVGRYGTAPLFSVDAEGVRDVSGR